MKVTKCDRCGTEMSTNGEYSVKVIDNNLLTPDAYARHYDLCENCARVLIKDFMRGEWNDD